VVVVTEIEVKVPRAGGARIDSNSLGPDVYHDLVLGHLPTGFEISEHAHSLVAECHDAGDTPEQCAQALLSVPVLIEPSECEWGPNEGSSDASARRSGRSSAMPRVRSPRLAGGVRGATMDARDDA
jgi:hypothetical protein